MSPAVDTWKLDPVLPVNEIVPAALADAVMPVAASAALPAIAVLSFPTVVAAVSVVSKATLKSPCVPVRPAPVICSCTVSAAPGAENVWAAAALTVATLPVAPVEKLPSSAFDTWSAPCTWNADVALLKLNCDWLLGLVLIAAVMLAFLNAVACWLFPLPAAWIAAFTAVTSVPVSVTPFRFTATVIVLPPLVLENPGPVKVKLVVLLVMDPWLAGLERMFATLVVLPSPISVPAVPVA